MDIINEFFNVLKSARFRKLKKKKKNYSLLCVRLGSTYFVKIEFFLLKVL